MSTKIIQMQILLSEFSKLKEKEIEHCKSKISVLEKMMVNYPEQRTLAIKYENYLSRFNLLQNISKELKVIKHNTYLSA